MADPAVTQPTLVANQGLGQRRSSAVPRRLLADLPTSADLALRIEDLALALVGLTRTRK
jgi:hypothetical protein